MKTNHIIFFLFLAIAGSCQTGNQNKNSNSMDFSPIPITYPFSRKDNTVSDQYFNTKVQDPYRWLEDDQSAETKDWVKKQNLVTFGYLSQIPFRVKVKERLTKIFNYEKFGNPFKKAGKYYFFKNDGLQNQSVFYVQDQLEGESRVVLNPNTFSADGTASLQELDISKDGKYLAYAVSKGGSDWRSIQIINLSTGENLPETLEWAKFTNIAWHGDGFYYTRYPEPKKGDELKGKNELGALWFHKVGTPQSEDVEIFKDEAHPNRFFGASTTDDERFLCLVSSESTSGNTLAFKDLSKSKSEFVSISDNFESDYTVIDNQDGKLVVRTNYKAPNQRLIRIDTEHPEEQNWVTLIPENNNDVLEDAVICGDKLVCTYLHNASSALRVYSFDGKFIQELPLPEIGTVAAVRGEKGENQAFYAFSSFLRPGAIYALDMQTLKAKVFKAPKIDFNPDAYTTEQVWYTSKDGARVPMFITCRKDKVLHGENPTLLYGYGGFNQSVTPAFSPSRALLLENNGIYVVANIRGGGEFGEKWHKAGTLCQKQNVFDDFIAAAEYLIKEKYTSPARLAIQGGSNGGLLIGACMTQRPDLFGVCFPQVGVLDMLRYHKFTIGYAWAVDYGRSDDETAFPCLYKYSPLHNVKKVAYPATLITTADHDDRVVPAHSFKFAATLQENQQGPNPVLIRIETSAGHGAGKPTAKIIDEAGDMLSFLFWQMKVQPIY